MGVVLQDPVDNGPVTVASSRRGRALLAAAGLLLVAGCTARPPGSAATDVPHRSAPGVAELGCPSSARVVGDHGGAVSSVGFNIEDDLLLSGGSLDGAIRIWDVATCTQHGPALRGPDATTLYRSVFSEDGSLIAGVDVARSRIQVWDAAHGASVATLPVSGASGGLAFCNLSRLAIGVRDHIVFRDAVTGAEVAPPLGHPGKIQALAYNFNCTWLVSGSDNGTVVVWSLIHQPAERLATFTVPSAGSVVDVATTGAGDLVAAAGLDNRAISLWRMPDATPVGSPVLLPGPARSVAFSPDEQHLAAGSDDSLVLIDTITGAPLCPPAPYSSGSVAYHRTGRLAAAGTDGKVRVWENDDALTDCAAAAQAAV
ncbi:hypothetical protein GCM10022255_116160 [Dactylosporangium darangshiense]|uniref:Uncharacterized protein n=1 Tax=Dactylosporangium darangshiense TaxID=579108 RepID=A0ABP8DWI7_9ACTN